MRHVSVNQGMWCDMFQSIRGCNMTCFSQSGDVGVTCFSQSGDVVWHVSVDQVMWSGMFQSIR